MILALLSGSGPRAQAQTATPDAPSLRIETGRHGTAIRGLSTDAHGRYVATVSGDKTVRIWDATTAAPLRVLRPPSGDGDEGKLYAVALSPDGRIVVCGGFTGPANGPKSLYVFDRATGRLLRRIAGTASGFTHMTYSPDGRFLAAALSDGGVRVYRADDFEPCGQDTDYGDQSFGVSFGMVHGVLRLATGCLDGQVRLYDVGRDGKLSLQAKRRTTAGTPCGVAFSPDGSKIAVGFVDAPPVVILSGTDLSPLFSPNTAGLRDAESDSVAWSLDGRTLYVGGSYQDAEGRCFIRRWADGGHGAAADTPAATNTVSDLQPRPAGGVFYASFDPAWGALDRTGKRIAFVGPSNADFRLAATGLRLSGDGSAVAFGYRKSGKDPAVFSPAARVLKPGDAPADFHAPVTAGPGPDVRDWNGSSRPTLDGEPLPLGGHDNSDSLAVAPDRQSFLLGTQLSLFRFGADGTPLWRVAAPGATWAVNVSGDGRLAVAAFGDGTIRWYRMTDGHALLAFYPDADRKRWVLWTPSGYYDCSPGGEDLIGWQVGHGSDRAADFFPAGRFRSAFYRPDVAGQVLSTLDEGAALKQADEAAGRQAPGPADATVQASLPPVVTILSPETGASVSGDSVTIRYSLRAPSGEPVTSVRLLVDGRPVQTDRDQAGRDLALVPAASTAEVTRQASVPIPTHDCTVSVIAQNRRATSEAATVALKWTGTAVKPAFTIKPTLYVLAVGIGKYKDASLSLEYPAADARGFADTMLAQKGRLYADVQTKVLLDGDATRDAVVDGLDWIQRQTTQHDVAMVFLAGHGANDSEGNYLFIPANFDRDRIKSTGLPFSEIKDTEEHLAGKALFFVDSCHSGNVLGTARSRGVDINGAVNELSSAENGAVVFAASTGSQVALEDPAWGHGAFTKALIEGIGGKADYGHNGTITVTMLDLYISQRVKELTHGEQTPTTAKPQTVPDFPVSVRP